MRNAVVPGMSWLVPSSLLLLAAPILGAAPGRGPLAFPGAEGFGRFARGGRGGDVYHVTTVTDGGPGSLRHGIETADGPRTIVFDVSGTIQLRSELRIDKSYLTLAGQTAPGDGITLRDHTVSLKDCHDVIIRYLRVRLGDKHKAPGGYDTLTTNDINDVILDHLSLSWAIDGTHDFRAGQNFTIQWCILSEALHDSIHPKGPHAMCASYREPDGPISLHHNLFSTCRDRHPTLGSADAGDPLTIVDFRNNVIYNWSATANFCDHFVNAVNNYWRPGPETDPQRLPIAMKGGLPDAARGYMSGNVFEGRDDWTADNYASLDWHRWLHPGSNYKYAGTLSDWRGPGPQLGADAPTTQSAKQAYELVLTHAGASLSRDAVDERVIADVRNRTGRLLDSQDEVGGWPLLRTRGVRPDSDRDGMPDAWETAHNLDAADPADGPQDPDRDGYTNLEEYINSRVPPVG
ncbi:MAG: hypothetical protein JSW27_21620 [Phycisphaerales bacterium]|nr:MAG: hypothetical protein JSW27_21620 [Phycisphaerales bacterium]